MTILALVLKTISPFIIKGITNLVKKTREIKFADNPVRQAALRAFTALFSLLAVVGTLMVSGDLSDSPALTDAIQILGETIVLTLSATGVYFFQKKRELDNK